MSCLIRHVACAVSGGVDSAVAALLLKRRGLRVSGIFMKNWDQIDETGRCSSDADREDAKHVCCHLDIPFHEVNFVKEYWNNIFSNFVEGYQRGVTPNPDVLCNRYIKFGVFFDYVLSQFGADALATGHYAQNSFGNFLEDLDRRDSHDPTRLLKAVDLNKDQTLFLSQVSHESLRRTMFPVGGLLKSDVRKMARDAGMGDIASKRDSTGLCFVGKRNFAKFIADYVQPKPGNFVDVDSGRIVGSHEGHHCWTLGQRALISGLSHPYFVARRVPETNDVFVASGTDHPALYSDSMVTEKPFWICESPFVNSVDRIHLDFRFQHTYPVQSCIVSQLEEGGLNVELDRPLRALSPGQYAVFYKGDECLGSAQILESGPSLHDVQRGAGRNSERGST